MYALFFAFTVGYDSLYKLLNMVRQSHNHICNATFLWTTTKTSCSLNSQEILSMEHVSALCVAFCMPKQVVMY